MADTQKKPQETSEQRTRSRSKTPGLLNLRVSVEKDLNGSQVKTKKGPSVTTIQEETSAVSSPLKSVTVKKTRTVTSDYSSADNTSPEIVVSVKKLTADAITEKTTRIVTTTTTSTTTTSASTKESASTPAIKEVRQNEVNKVLENAQTAILRTSTPKATSKSHQKSKITLTPEELQRHVAYKEYKDAGEYWNKFPKTDYTYSELSPHRRELAPGMIAMPNMSRPGLTKHAERVSVMIQRNPQQESFIRQRYASSGAVGGSFAHSDPYDSGEEQLDLSQLSGAGRSYRSFRKSTTTTTTVREEHRSIVSRFFLAIVNLFYGSAHSVSRLFNKSEHNMYYTRIEDERGFFGRLYALFNALLTGIFKKLYLLISTVLFLDTWLLQTSASDIAQGRRKRKFLLWLLVLLPFLLFGGIYLYLDPTPIESLLATNPLQNFKLPTMPDTAPVREFAQEKWTGARDYAAVWLDSLKTLSENGLAEARKIWQENVNNVF